MDQQQLLGILAKILESQKDLSKNQEEMSKNLKKIEVIIENDIAIKISALYDSREVQKNHNSIVDNALDRIEKKVEVLQLETSILNFTS